MNYQISITNFTDIKTVKDFQTKLKQNYKKSNLTNEQREKIEEKIRSKPIQNEINEHLKYALSSTTPVSKNTNNLTNRIYILILMNRKRN